MHSGLCLEEISRLLEYSNQKAIVRWLGNLWEEIATLTDNSASAVYVQMEEFQYPLEPCVAYSKTMCRRERKPSINSVDTGGRGRNTALCQSGFCPSL